MQWSVIPMSTAIGMKGSKATISKRCRSIPHVANILLDFGTPNYCSNKLRKSGSEPKPGQM